METIEDKRVPTASVAWSERIQCSIYAKILQRERDNKDSPVELELSPRYFSVFVCLSSVVWCIVFVNGGKQGFHKKYIYITFQQ